MILFPDELGLLAWREASAHTEEIPAQHKRPWGISPLAGRPERKV